MDIGIILFSSAIKIIENIITNWITNKQRSIYLSTLDMQITRAVKIEARNLQVRVDALEKETMLVKNALLSKMSEFSIVKTPIAKKLKIEYDPDEPSSVEQLMSSLKQRIILLESERSPDTADPNSTQSSLSEDTSSSTLTPILVPANKTNESNLTTNLSSQLINQLKQKVDELENQGK